MLNYFLLQLVGPQRKSLSLKDPEKYEFRPKDLLKQVGIHGLFFASNTLVHSRFCLPRLMMESQLEVNNQTIWLA